MPSYLIRLDDACPGMNRENWERMEKLLDFYLVKPIVGVIPNNMDSDFCWDSDPEFWTKALAWQDKGWELSMHGLNHLMHYHKPDSEYYQLSHGINTEFAGVPFETQRLMILEGIKILKEHGIETRSFFAPAHTYDANTVKVLAQTKTIKFISDGYALRAYRKDGMTFIPSICDGPFKMPFGLYTYVFHPSMMKEKDFISLEKFLKENTGSIISTDECLNKVRKSQGVAGRVIEKIIFFLRGMRKLRNAKWRKLKV